MKMKNIFANGYLMERVGRNSKFKKMFQIVEGSTFKHYS